jgi:hypothetical protein
VALLAVGTTIGAPTYGTYRLVKHIRNKRRGRQARSHSLTPSDVTENISANADDEDLNRAIEASKETYRAEVAKQEGLLEVYSDDDSFDD